MITQTSDSLPRIEDFRTDLTAMEIQTAHARNSRAIAMQAYLHAFPAFLTLRQLTEEGRLVIASHHDMDTVRGIYDEVVLLRRRMIAFGTVAGVFTTEKLDETFGPDGKEAA